MTWIALLLADPSPCLRALVLRELMGRADDDPELQELAQLRASDPLVSDLLALQAADGSWTKADSIGLGHSDRIHATAQALLRLGYLGFGPADEAVQRGAEWLFARQQPDGAWPLPRSDDDGGGAGRLFDHLAPDLAAAAGIGGVRLRNGPARRARLRMAAGAASAGRRLAHRHRIRQLWLCGRLSAAGAFALGLPLEHDRRARLPGAAPHAPHKRRGAARPRPAAGPRNREAAVLGYEVARIIGAELAHGFLTTFARFDLAQLLDLCWRVGATTG